MLCIAIALASIFTLLICTCCVRIGGAYLPLSTTTYYDHYRHHEQYTHTHKHTHAHTYMHTHQYQNYDHYH